MSISPTPLRAVVVFHGLGIVGQAVLAGQFLSGADSSVRMHEVTGWIVAAACILQILLAVLIRKTPLWFTMSSVLIFLGEGLQVGTGYGRFLGVHIPLSIVITFAVMGQAVWLFGRTAPAGHRE